MIRRASLLASLALLAPFACTPSPVAPPAPTPAAPASAPPAASSASPADASDRLVAAMLRRVVARRTLPALTPVKSRTLDRSELLAQIKAQGEKDIPADVIRGQGIILQAMGWIPPGYDHERGNQELLQAQLAGYYEPAAKTMFLARDLPASEAEATLAHELVHALQDQHYDLGPGLAYRPESGDKPSALQALAEGDATSAMMEVLLEDQARSSLDLPEDELLALMEAQTLGTSPTVPTVLKASLIAPYTDGFRFVQALRRRGGWAEVDRVWKRPPSTTEQLLHLDKYDANEGPLPVPPPPTHALGGGFRVALTDLMGEQTLRIVLNEHASSHDAQQAAAGWGGDRVTLLSRPHAKGEEFFVTWWLRFDGSPGRCEHARDAAVLMRRGVKPQGGKMTTDPVCLERPDLGPLAVMASGCDVVMTAGPFAKFEENWRSTGSCSSVEPWLKGYVQKPTP